MTFFHTLAAISLILNSRAHFTVRAIIMGIRRSIKVGIFEFSLNDREVQLIQGICPIAEAWIEVNL